MNFKFFIMLFSFFVLIGCSVNHGTYTVLSNKIVSVKDFDMGSSIRKRNVEGESVRHIIFIIPTGQPSLSEALTDAFNKTDTDVMTDVSVTSWFFLIPYIYGSYGWSVNGDAVKTRKN